jgi:ATP-dependent Clp protease ATP-binding subunit ClpC
LLDEIEKAHPDVFNLLLQVLDDGRLTDSQGRTVSFKNTVLIMTSNLGSELITANQASVGFETAGTGNAQRDLRDRITRRLREELRPEFINRIDDIVIFGRLEPEQLTRITDLMLEQTRRRMHAQNIAVEFSPAAIKWLVDHGYEPAYGARPMRRTIQREVDNRLSEMLLDGRVSAGQKVRVDERDGQLTFEVESTVAA